MLILAIFGCSTPPRNPEIYIEPFTKMRFVYLPPGHFKMGSLNTEKDRQPDETLHDVFLTPTATYIGAFEVTQDEWSRVMDTAPSAHTQCGPKCPVENVTYHDVQLFIEKLNRLAHRSRFRLPTEAEWEYACRAGTSSPYAFGPSLSAESANVDSAGPLPVGSFGANAWGIHDMHGNVWEWTSTWYGPYPSATVYDPTGPSDGDKRVIRGGSWHFGPDSARCALRYTHAPSDRGFSLGFRLIREAM